MAVCCSSTKIGIGMYAGLDINGKWVCHPFKPLASCQTQQVKVWLSKHPSSPDLPSEISVAVFTTDSDGIPTGSALASGTINVSAFLDETGEEYTVNFLTVVTFEPSHRYGLVFWLTYSETGSFSIIIGGGENDSCPWETGGDTIPVIEAEYPDYVWEVKAGPCVPAYYSFTATGANELTVVTLAATGLTNTTATLNGKITFIPEGTTVTTRGFQWGTTEALGSEWSESDSFGVEAFSHEITGLTPDTTYYFRAFACAGT